MKHSTQRSPNAHCCRGDAIPYQRETRDVRDCELACLEVAACLFFSHSIQHRMCHLCKRCNTDIRSKAYTSWQLSHNATVGRARSQLLLDSIIWSPPAEHAPAALRHVFWVQYAEPQPSNSRRNAASANSPAPHRMAPLASLQGTPTPQ